MLIVNSIKDLENLSKKVSDSLKKFGEFQKAGELETKARIEREARKKEAQKNEIVKISKMYDDERKEYLAKEEKTPVSEVHKWEMEIRNLVRKMPRAEMLKYLDTTEEKEKEKMGKKKEREAEQAKKREEMEKAPESLETPKSSYTREREEMLAKMTPEEKARFQALERKKAMERKEAEEKKKKEEELAKELSMPRELTPQEEKQLKAMMDDVKKFRAEAEKKEISKERKELLLKSADELENVAKATFGLGK